MKILILTNHSYMFYQFRRELTEELLKNHDIVLSTPFVGYEDYFMDKGCHVIETYVDRRGINPFKDLKLIKTYYSMIKEQQPDKVITYSIKPNIYAGMVCRFLNIPYYVNVQGLGTAFQKPILSSFVTFLYKFALKKANKVFFENQGNALLFQEKKIISKSKEVVLNGAGINLEHYSYQEYPNNQKIHFLFVGRIMKEKGVDELFASIRKLNQQYPNQVVLDIVGFFEDEYKEQVEELEKEGLACYHGFQKEVRPFYKAANCIVLPSYHEGMSNVLLEASAIGRPIITSMIPGCMEAVDNEKTGYTCIVKDVDDLYKHMDMFMHLSFDEKEMMGRNAREKMIKEFNKKDVVNMTIKNIME